MITLYKTLNEWTQCMAYQHSWIASNFGWICLQNLTAEMVGFVPTKLNRTLISFEFDGSLNSYTQQSCCVVWFHEFFFFWDTDFAPQPYSSSPLSLQFRFQVLFKFHRKHISQTSLKTFKFCSINEGKFDVFDPDVTICAIKITKNNTSFS